jgi:hypothetical protein
MTIALAVLSPLLALAGVLIGAYFAKNRETDKYRKDRITAAYTALLEANAKNSGPRAAITFSKLGAKQRLTPDEQQYIEEAQTQFVSAHSHVLIHGSEQVIAALSRFYDAQGLAERMTPEGRDAYVALLGAMRNDSEAHNYGDFDEHVDNILVSGPERRRQAMIEHSAAEQERAPAPPAPSGPSISYSQSSKPAE